MVMVGENINGEMTREYYNFFNILKLVLKNFFLFNSKSSGLDLNNSILRLHEKANLSKGEI